MNGPVWRDSTVHETFAAGARRWSAAVAAVLPNAAGQTLATLTYGELDRRADALARELAARGVGPGSFVAIYLERSLESIVAVLGILKAGGAYVPLDPAYPAQRIEFMLADTAAPVVLTQSALAGRLPAGPAEVMILDRDWGRDAPAEGPPSIATTPQSPAYVIYTSGSTGEPKGVCVPHRGVLRLVHGQSFTPLDPTRILLQLAPVSFDAATLEIWGALLHGGRCVLYPKSGVPDLRELAAVLTGQGVTTLWLTASLFNIVIDQAPEALAGVPEVLTGGEALSVPHVRRALERLPHTQLVNGYGPTESTTFTCCYRIPRSLPDVRSIPIGAPIAHTSVHILDEAHRPVALGAVGRLHIGGDGLAIGYLNRPELTAERFVEVEVEGTPTRLYDSGDLARWLDDGTIEFLGRTDDQVKIRGFRIELGEIEAALGTLEGVREAVVLAREDEPGDKCLTAYVVPEPGRALTPGSLRCSLSERLPEYMIPVAFVFLERLPLTANGKTDRAALPGPGRARPDVGRPCVAPRTKLERWLTAAWQDMLGLDEVGIEDRFFELGGTSLKATRFVAALGQEIGEKVPIVALFDAPTIALIADVLRAEYPKAVAARFGDGELVPGTGDRQAPLRAGPGGSGDDIAIIGLAGRFPQAADVEQFWKNLVAGVEARKPVTESDLMAAGLDPALLRDPDYVASSFTLEEAECFDAAFFGFTPREAELMDPQQRLFLEVAYAALEDAGYDCDRLCGRVGVFGGVGRNAYLLTNLASHPQYRDRLIDHTFQIGNERDFPATHVAYKLNLRGPAVNVQTACSTSGVALHLACQALRSGECDMALVGGCKVLVPTHGGYLYVEGGALSPEGRVRAFDAKAAGMVRGSGGGVVVLKRLREALADGDNVRAVVKGSAVNNDGAGKIGFAAPSVAGQAEVIVAALDAAGVAADGVSYVETHGTGTILGDPIEVAGLIRAFRKTSARTAFCAIGSVKTNIGHLDAGASVAGVIKTVLALEREALPPSLNFTEPNPQIDFTSSPFFVNASLRPWPRGGEPRRAGVSSFGLGGTNSHVILEEAPLAPPPGPTRPHQLLVLSAKTPAALEAASRRLADHLDASVGPSLGDVAYTLAMGRRRHACRRVVIASDVADAAAVLRGGDPRRVVTETAAGTGLKVVFLFPGGGAQYAGMAQGLYEAEATFREVIDRCAAILGRRIDHDVRHVIFNSAGDIERPSLGLPALFAVEYALAALWKSWGVVPAAMIGHSMGEYTAACLAGVLSLESALALVTCRGRLFETLPEGGMLSVPLGPDEARRHMSPDLDFAAINRPDQCVVSGPSTAVANMQAVLERADVESRRIHIAVAAHSRLVAPILEEFRSFLHTIDFGEPRLPWVSNVTGTWIGAAEARSPDYWVDHLRSTVRFSDGLATVFADGARALVEVGPGQTLSTFALQHPGRPEAPVVVPSLRHPKETTVDPVFLQRSLGRLWLGGVDVDWNGYFAGETRHRVSLPTYPFERLRFWIAPASAGVGAVPPAESVLPVPAIPAAVPTPPPPNIVVLPKEEPPVPTAAPRHDRIVADIRTMIHELSGVPIADIKEHATFLELGFDSLFLAQVTSSLRKKVGLKIPVRQLIEKTPSVDALAGFLDRELPGDAFAATPPPAPQAQPAPAAAVAAPVLPVGSPPAVMPLPMAAGTGAPAGAVQQLIVQQLQLMQQQLMLLAGGTAAPAPSAVTVDAAGTVDAAPAAAAPVTPAEPRTAVPPPPPPDADKSSPWRPVDKADRTAARDTGLSPEQQAHVDALIARVCERAPSSKSFVARHRRRLADPRTVQGFKLQWKEMVFPIVAARTAGSKIWDLDGNEYIDLVNGYGVTFLGHSPSFVTEAVKKQLDLGVEIGPQNRLVGEVAELVCELTGAERAALCNTGSEAVLAAMRLARTVTGKDKIATFQGHYHGIFDEVLVKGVEGADGLRPMPIAPGIPRKKVEDTIVMKFGDPKSFDVIRKHADEIALVMMEPVRSRNPDLRPVDFIRELRRLTEELDIPLLFDEMVTGFRCHPGGAQAYFGVRADLATYGKVVGGGYPIGVVAGKARYMDALDGGMWNFGDASVPEADMTWFAGTFVRHPVAMAAAHATLSYLKGQGPGLQESLNRRTTDFVNDLNAHFQDTGAPIWVEHFSSFFVLKFVPFQEYSALLFYHLHNRGIYTYEGRPAFFTTAHSEEDFARVSAAIKDAVAEMQRVHLFPGTPLEDAPWEIPLAEGQQEIWLATRFGRDASCAFNLSSTLNLKGELDLSKMRRAMLQLVRRHEALRCVPNPDGHTQRVMPAPTLEVPLVDLSALGEADRQSRLEAIKTAEVRTEFDLDRGPLYRMQIVRLGRAEHEVIITVHHMVADGWSCGVLLRDLGRLYAALRDGKPHGLPAPMPYSEWIADCNSAERAPKRAAAVEYWLGEYVDAVPVLELPTDRPRPPFKTFGARRVNLSLDASLTQRLRKMAGKQGATLFTGVLAAFHALIHRLSGQDDLVVGFSLAGQASVEGRDLVGHCVNFLPLRARIDERQTFSEYVKALRHKVLDASDNQDFTFGTLVRQLNIPRDPSRTPLISVAFNLDPSSLGISFADLECRPGSVPRQYDNFDIFFNLVERESGLEIQCTYNADLWDQETMARRLEEYRTLLEATTVDPDRRMVELPLLTAEERQKLLVEWNATAAEYPRERGVHELVGAQVARTPDAVAVVFEGEQLSYAELEASANRLARHLGSLGVTRGTLVGLCVERSPRMLVGLLGILKAGGAYVPLDPSYPAERLAFMVSDSGMSFLVTERRLGAELGLEGPRVVCLDGEEAGEIAAASVEALPVSTQPEDPAYVIYTSGSTGKPKGVLVPHRTVVNLLASVAREPGMAANDVVLAVTTLSFDIAVSELILPLVVGARVVLMSRDDAVDGARLLAAVREHRVTFIDATPATWRLLIEAGWAGGEGLKAICTGEAMPRDLAEQLVERAGSVWNGYGPTETTVWSTFQEIRRPVERILIGRPIANTQIHVLDKSQQLVPMGVVGEIYIGGAGVTKGYLNRPELTAERFVPDPFRGEGRMYRTGDLGRWLADGTLECLGRIDNQVKVRGYRIELGEIEAALAAEASIDQAVVAAREMRPGDVRLVAYLVRRQGPASSDEQLRARLRSTLPEYMVPQHFKTMASLPLTPSGKVDRKALPAPEVVTDEAQGVEPRTEMERIVAAAWQEALGVPRLSVRDNFFHLGGHSLLASQIVARLAREHGFGLTLRSMFEAPTIESLAKLIDRGSPGAALALHAPIPRRADQAEAPASLMQQRLWFLEQLAPNQVAFNVPSSFRLRGRLNVEALERALNEIVRRHSSTRTTFRWDDEGLFQVVALALEVRLAPVIDLRKRPEAEREQDLRALLRERMREPFDLTRGPLFRVALIRLGEEEHVLSLLTHHMVWDGWSFDIYRHDLNALYAAFSQGRPSPLPEVPITYGDFSAWQRGRLQGPALTGDLDYWKTQLGGELEPLDLPSDRQRPAVRSDAGDGEWMRFTRAEVDTLRALAHRYDCTLFMVMLAAFKVLLYRYTGQEDVRVGTAVRGRIHQDTQDLIGFFVNTLVLRSHLAPDMTFAGLLGAVRRTTLDAFSHEETPFELLVQELKVHRDLSRTPIVQHLFSFQDARQRETTIGDLRLDLVPVLPPAAQTDLTMWFVENRDGLVGALNYSTDLFDAATVRRMLEHYRTLIGGIVADPDRRMVELPLLTAEERQKLLVEWNATAAEYPRERGVHELVGAQVARTPDAVAVVFEGEQLSYAELEASANRLARHLGSLGVTRGTLVGLCMERSPRMLVGLLGILKAGGAYVPLDPSYPAERLAFMVSDSGMSFLVTERRLGAELGLEGPRVVCLDGEEAGEIAAASVEALPVSTQPEDPAYVIYTSGSTGKPKGVLVPHRTVVNLLASVAREPGMAANDVVLAVTTLSFDIAVSELILPLVVGARVVLMSRDDAVDGARLLAAVREHRVTFIDATPATWRLLIEAGWAGGEGLKAICTGEAMPRDLAEQLVERAGSVWNGYGPTETTVWSTFQEIRRPVERILIGRPIANTQIHVLDKSQQLVPMGVVGEIYIGGAGVTKGYLNRPELTAERFVPDPFRGEGRMYRTGDLGRWLADGTLECLGRIDNQVKVRGYRIELGEIEAALAEHESIEQAVVVARELRPGEVRLIAHLIPRDGRGVSEPALRQHLRTLLPEYMVPQQFVAAPGFPLTPSGKVDRKALPNPELVAAEGGSYAAPRTPEEEIVAGVFAEVLKLERVGIDDHFFDLGGHSLLAMQVVSRIYKALGVELPVNSVFSSPTPSRLAASLVDLRAAADTRLVPPPLVRMARDSTVEA